MSHTTRLACGVGLLLMLAHSPGWAQEWKRGEDTLTLLMPRAASSAAATSPGLFPVMTYRFAGAPKPYVKELFTPGGVQVLLDSPADHVHHRGLMFAVAIDGLNFWEESPASGRQVSETIETLPTVYRPEAVQRLSSHVQWLSPDGKVVADETRLLFIEPHQNYTLLRWTTNLQPSATVTLAGNHYCGLGMRFVRAMDERGQFITADGLAGEVVRGHEKLYTGDWCAYLSEVDGKPVTVAMFNHPGNPRPVTWFTMMKPFAYLSATLRLHEKPLVLRSDQSAQLGYGVAVWDGHVGPDDIEKTYSYDYLMCSRPVIDVGAALQRATQAQATQPAEVKP
jgi:hypothetical protein